MCDPEIRSRFASLEAQARNLLHHLEIMEEKIGDLVREDAKLVAHEGVNCQEHKRIFDALEAMGRSVEDRFTQLTSTTLNLRAAIWVLIGLVASTNPILAQLVSPVLAAMGAW